MSSRWLTPLAPLRRRLAGRAHSFSVSQNAGRQRPPWCVACDRRPGPVCGPGPSEALALPSLDARRLSKPPMRSSFWAARARRPRKMRHFSQALPAFLLPTPQRLVVGGLHGHRTAGHRSRTAGGCRSGRWCRSPTGWLATAPCRRRESIAARPPRRGSAGRRRRRSRSFSRRRMAVSSGSSRGQELRLDTSADKGIGDVGGNVASVYLLYLTSLDRGGRLSWRRAVWMWPYSSARWRTRRRRARSRSRRPRRSLG